MLDKEYFRLSQRSNPIADLIVGLWRGAWRDYSSIYENPGLFAKLVTDNPLLVVHPGYLGYVPREDKSEIDFDQYHHYLERLHAKVADALDRKRTVLVFTPTEYLEETLAAIGNPKGTILIPTMERSVTEDNFLLLGPGYEFLEALAVNVERVEICGEVREECVMEVERRMALHGAQVNSDELCTFSPRQLSV